MLYKVISLENFAVGFQANYIFVVFFCVPYLLYFYFSLIQITYIVLLCRISTVHMYITYF